MKKTALSPTLVFLISAALLLLSCSSSEPENSALTDGLMLKYIHSAPYLDESTGTYTFKKTGKNKYEVMIEKDDKERKEVLDGNFRFVDGIAKNTTLTVVGGGIVWISPDGLSENTVPDHHVMELTRKNGYSAYKLKYELVDGCYSYYEEETGILVATEQHVDKDVVHTRLVATNAGDLQ
ncbi:MAG: hypothetical protein SWH61_13585 [Thermodesulfobacteriota bacterium]|nr:hypothetical protein [Thermodesulfobacteriota bacterium]